MGTCEEMSEAGDFGGLWYPDIMDVALMLSEALQQRRDDPDNEELTKRVEELEQLFYGNGEQ